MKQIITKETPLKTILELAAPCTCNSCSNGCKHGSGIMVGEDKKNIAKFLNISEKELDEKYLEGVEQFNKKFQRPKLIRENKPYGKCIFFDGKLCTIHEVKPLQCKTSIGCKDYGEEISSWFLLNNLLDEHDPEAVRQYSQFIQNKGKVIPGGNLEEIVPDKIKLRKILNYEMLK